MIATGCLFALMIIATATDVWRQKIYNWTTYTGIATAFLLSGLATLLSQAVYSEIEIGASLLGFVSCGSIMLVCFVLFQIGGGDVKLLAMVGAFLGVEAGVEALLWTFVLGGASALIILIWRIGFLKLVQRMIQQIMVRMGFGRWDPLSEGEREQMQLPLYLAPSALLGVAVVTFEIVEQVANLGN
ncbi:MAG: A24 family peptidase [Mariniblastus sp.]|nr:A24 family peptidase [Mariniblastus sp.]